VAIPAMPGEKRSEPDYRVKLLAASLSLGLILMFARGEVIGFRYVQSLLGRASRLILAAYYDFLYVTLVTVAFLGLLLMPRRSERARRGIYRLFLLVALASVLVALANIKVVPMLGRPFNYQWLYYSDFLNSQDAWNAISEDLNWKIFAVGAGGLVSLIVLSRLVYAGLRTFGQRFGARRLVIAATAVLLVYFPLGRILLRRADWPRSLLENPVLSFASSLAVAEQSPGLLTMKTSVGPADFEPPESSSSTLTHPGPAQVRNVLLVVLESVPAEYLDPFGSNLGVTPELERYRSRSALFTNIYAHCPSTTYSLVSLLLSMYPRISYRSLTEELPGVSFPSLSSELRRRGFQTGFFDAADLRFQDSGVFLSYRKFDKIEDHRTLCGERPVLHVNSERFPFLDGKDDACVAEALLDWIDEAPEESHFGVVWTMMTHYPYFSGGQRTDFVVGDKGNRYLNALNYDDRVLGGLIRALEQRHLDRSTLLVIVGDHGEAFGRHGQVGHALNIYEENVHVPLMLINPDLFHGERLPVVGGLIDIAPTILDVLNLAPPPEWQGRSLWDRGRSGRVYFFAPWSRHLFGLRENDTKVIYDASDNHFEIYNLAEDPHETTNLARQAGQATEMWSQRLAAWVQYQRAMTLGLMTKGAGESLHSRDRK
jgi:lipoteichoic acid synthase